MAHFLSDVTHQKLDQRREPISATCTKGLRAVEDFTASVRCVEVVPRRTVAGSNDFVVWTGDQDGTISIRVGILGEEAFKIEKKRNVFVYCLLHYNDHVWAGLSDGYLRIFHVETFDLVFETKMHAAGIACMTYASGFIFTGGYDWQILQWDPEEMRIVQHGQYSGHQNAVRCFASDGSLLFSGGDDYSIRCWDIDMGSEKMAPWPVIGHRGGIRDLVIMEVYMFSASQDGCVKVWNTQTGQLVKVLERRETAYTSLMRDVSSSRVWCGNVDGTISIWNALTLEHVCTLPEHSGSFVCKLHAMRRLNAMKAWSIGENGTVKVWFSETDATDMDYDRITQMESDHQRMVESMRGRLIENYSDLEKRRLQLTRIEKIDQDRKTKLASAFATKLTLDIKRQYFDKIMKWRIQRRLKHKLQSTAAASYNKCSHDLLIEYYWKLEKYLRYNKDRRRKGELGTALLRSTENGLLAAYLKNLLEFARREKNSEGRRALAATMASGTQRSLLRMFYSTLARFAVRQRQKKKRESIVGAIMRSSDSAVTAAYWDLLAKYVKSAKADSKRSTATAGLLASTENGLRRIYFAKLQTMAKKRIDKRRRGDISSSLLRGLDSCLLKIYFNKLNRFGIIKKAMPLEEQLNEVLQRVKEMEDLLAAQKFMTEDELEAELKRRADELARIQGANNDYDAQIKALEAEQRRLKMELRKENYLDPTKSPEEQLEQALYLMKARGVNCKADHDDILSARTIAAKNPDKVFDLGVVKVQKIFAKAVAPEKLKEDPNSIVWLANPDAIDRIKKSKKSMDGCTEGIVDIVVAYDVMAHEKKHNWFHEGDIAPEHKKKQELLANCNNFLDIVMEHFHRCHDAPAKGSKGAKGATAAGKKGTGTAKPKAGAARSVSPAGRPAARRSATPQARPPATGGASTSRTPARSITPRPKPSTARSVTPQGRGASRSTTPQVRPTTSASPARGTTPGGRGASATRSSPAARQSASPRSASASPASPKPIIGFTVSNEKTEQGVKVIAVLAGGPAEQAGLLVGDFVSTFGGDKVKGKKSLSAAVAAHAVPGQGVELKYFRGDAENTITVIVGGKTN